MAFLTFYGTMKKSSRGSVHGEIIPGTLIDEAITSDGVALPSDYPCLRSREAAHRSCSKRPAITAAYIKMGATVTASTFVERHRSDGPADSVTHVTGRVAQQKVDDRVLG